MFCGFLCIEEWVVKVVKERCFLLFIYLEQKQVSTWWRVQIPLVQHCSPRKQNKRAPTQLVLYLPRSSVCYEALLFLHVFGNDHFLFLKKKMLYVRYSFCVGGCSLFSMVVVVFWSVVFRLFFFPGWAWSVDAKMGDRGAGCWIRWSLHFLPSIKGCLQCSICACFIVMEGRHIVS